MSWQCVATFLALEGVIAILGLIGMDRIHTFGAWLFFADVEITPLAVFGACCLGWWARVAVERWGRR